MRTVNMLRSVLLFAIALSLLAAPLAPQARAARPTPSQDEVQRRKQALGVFKQGRTAYKAGDYDAALTFFRKAQALYEHEALIILALAKTLDRAKEIEKARSYYKLFLKEAPPTDAARAKAVQRIGEIDALLAARPGVLLFKGLPSAATLKVNGHDLQPDAKGALELKPGLYSVRVELANNMPFERKNIELKAGETREIQVVLHQPPDPSTLPHDHKWTWILASATGVAALATGGAALKAYLVRGDYYELFDKDGAPFTASREKYGCATQDVTKPENRCPELTKAGSELKADADRWNTITAVSGLVAGGLAVATAVAYFTAPVKSDKPSKATLWLAPSPSSPMIGMTLRF